MYKYRREATHKGKQLLAHIAPSGEREKSMNHVLGNIWYPLNYLRSIATHQSLRFRKSKQELHPEILELAYLGQFASPGFDPVKAYKARREKRIKRSRSARAWRIAWSLVTTLFCLNEVLVSMVLTVLSPELIFVAVPHVIFFGAMAIFAARKLFEGLYRWR